MAGKVTDPALLAELEGTPSAKVSDPALLAQLEGTPEEEPGRLSKMAQTAGETAADFLAGRATIGRILDPAMAAVGALGSYVVPYTAPEGATFGERFKNEMEGIRRTHEEAQQRSPKAYVAGALSTLKGASSLPMPITRALPEAAPLLTKALAGVGDAAILNGAYSGAANIDNDPMGSFMKGATSPWNLLGGVAPLASEALPAARALKQKGGALLDKLSPRIEASPAAQSLLGQGVEGLTIGQLNPKTKLAQLEEAATSLPAVGPGLKTQRGAAVDSWRDVVLKKALAPGMKELPEGDVQGKLSAIYEGFEPAYAGVKGKEIFPAIHNGEGGIPLQSNGKTTGAIDLAVNDPSVLATDATRAMVAKFLNNELTQLPGKTARPGMVTEVPVENFLSMRSNIRQARRQAIAQQDYPAAQLLDRAEQAVTDAIQSQLPKEAADQLTKADQQYAVYKTVEDAVHRAGASGDFTPSHLAAAVKKATDKGSFARGGGGTLRDLAQSGKEVFDAKIPMNGAMVAAELPGWMGGKFAHGALAYGMNTPTGRGLLLRAPGEVAPMGQAGQSAGPSPAVAAALARALGMSPELPPANAPMANQQLLAQMLRQREDGNP